MSNTRTIVTACLLMLALAQTSNATPATNIELVGEIGPSVIADVLTIPEGAIATFDQDTILQANEKIVILGTLAALPHSDTLETLVAPDGASGANGAKGHSIRLIAPLIEVGSDAIVRAGDGAAGQDVIAHGTAPQVETRAIGGSGGDGGSIHIEADRLDLQGIVRPGDGSDGGDATAIGADGTLTHPDGGGAVAIAGPAGQHGVAFANAEPLLEALEDVGGGNGGDATALGGDGTRSHCTASRGADRGQVRDQATTTGGSAAATALDGGNGFTGSTPGCNGGRGGYGGYADAYGAAGSNSCSGLRDGGDATAKGGSGGTGGSGVAGSPGPPGAPGTILSPDGEDGDDGGHGGSGGNGGGGGGAYASGGHGGTGGVFCPGGNGGDATATAGNGGNGGSAACGGAGGSGGAGFRLLGLAAGSDGSRGSDGADGNRGTRGSGASASASAGLGWGTGSDGVASSTDGVNGINGPDPC